MNSEGLPIALTADELVTLTGYERPTNQLKMFERLGIPAQLRPDNTVLVLRMHCQFPASKAAFGADKATAAPPPKLKSKVKHGQKKKN